MAELGTYYIDIVPSTEGLGGKIEQAMGIETSQAGTSSGNGFLSSFKDTLNNGAGAVFNSFGNALKGLTGQLVSGAKDAFNAFGNAAKGLSQQFISGAKDVAAYGDNVDKMSQKIGISAQSYQQWSYVMERAGTSVDNLKMGMKTLSAAAESNSDAFKELGISEDQLKSLSQEDLFGEVIKGLSSMEEGAERTALATKLLGRAGTDLGPLLNEGTEAIEEQMEMAEKYGMVMSDEAVQASAAFTDSMTTLQGTMTGLKNRMMGEFLPSLTKVTDGLALVFTGDTSGIDQMVEGIQEMGDQIAELLPKVLEIGGPILEGLATSIMDNLPALGETALQMLSSFAEFIIQALPQLAETAVTLISTLASDLGQQLPILIPAAVEAVTTIVNGLINNIPQLIPAALQLIIGLGSGLIQAIPTLLTNIPTIIGSLVNGLLDQVPTITNTGIDLLSSLVSGLSTIIANVTAPIGEIISSLVEGFLQGVSDMADVGSQLVEGIWNGISNMTTWIGEKIRGFGSTVLDGLKSFFGIASPSKLFRDEIGKNLVMGFAEGITDNEGLVTKAMNELADVASGSIQSELAINAGSGFKAGQATNIGNVSLHFHDLGDMDEERIAQYAIDKLVETIKGEQAVWAY